MRFVQHVYVGESPSKEMIFVPCTFFLPYLQSSLTATLDETANPTHYVKDSRDGTPTSDYGEGKEVVGRGPGGRHGGPKLWGGLVVREF